MVDVKKRTGGGRDQAAKEQLPGYVRTTRTGAVVISAAQGALEKAAAQRDIDYSDPMLIGPQSLWTPGGEELVVISREEYDSLVERAGAGVRPRPAERS